MASFFLSKTKPPFYFERPSMRFLTADFPEKNTYFLNSNIESNIHIHSKQLYFEDNEIELSILFFIYSSGLVCTRFHNSTWLLPMESMKMT